MSSPELSLQAARLPLAERPPTWVWALALGLLVLLLLGLGRAPLFDVDEGAFSEATREMLASGDWGHTTLNGADRFDKPIGVYWLQALSAQIFGLNEFAMRLPSALATWFAALAVGGFVASQWGWRAAALAGVVHVTSFGPWAMAHAATADALLGLFLMLSALDLWRYLERGHLSALRRLAAWVGLGLLVKGPVAVLIPAAVLLLACLAQGQWRWLRQALTDVWAWAILLAIAVPWYAYALWRHGEAFVEGFILRHNIDRFAAPMEGHAGGWFYFVLVAPLLWMPWTPLLLTWWGRLGLIWRDSTVRHALIWVAFVLVFFSLSSTKLPHYGIYAAPGMVVLLVAGLEHLRSWQAGLCGGLLLIWHALMLVLPMAWLDKALGKGVSFVGHESMNSYALGLWPVAVAWGLCLAALLLWRRARQRLGAVGILSSMAGVHVVVMTLLIWPWWADHLQGPVKTLGLAARAWAGTVAQVGGHWPSFAFYRQDPMVKEVQQADMVLTRTQRPAEWAHWETLATAQGMTLLRRPAKEDKP
jgi:4-amino-4-deoxy-L-arabinose transferase-like glycosyltransferase